MQKDTLYLGSQSQARRRLLEFAQINYQLLTHGSDEELTHKPAAFNDYVLAIAAHKMQALVLPEPSAISTNYLYVLTADTLIRNPINGQILAKPNDRAHAIEMLTAERQAPMEVVTGCCLEKFSLCDNRWVRSDYAHWTTGATIEFCVDDDAMDRYFTAFPFVLQCSGAGMVEDHGLSYLKSVNGSYTAVIGLPLYELRQALKKMGFRF